MSRCFRCGGEIEFRYIDRRLTPIHLSGGWCQGDRGVGGRTTVEFTPPERRFEDVCRARKCPQCQRPVYFFTHNGGSVWVDELGWPWPKHACFDRRPAPTWFDYFKKTLERKPQYRAIVGVVFRAKWMPGGPHLPAHILLAVDAGDGGKVCVATTGANTADYLLGRMASADLNGMTMITSNHEERPIFNVMVPPWLLDLPDKWATIPYPQSFRPYPELKTHQSRTHQQAGFHQESPESAARIANWITQLETTAGEPPASRAVRAAW
ncbi:hypothetical protein [Aromatoleum anaerobium]|uniref:hypothetical protein n=1 Tax=Aromatoleum anaerobium TaxID=182180 RepID=UPI00145C5146|nr:hypothetical protein [Aromatoleum anaerobium]MCK0506323.1 hypothetical protein [Aromatoleum anaerobium]